MADELLNGRAMRDWELAVVAYGRDCELARDREQLAGLLTEYPREESPARRPVTDVSLALLP